MNKETEQLEVLLDRVKQLERERIDLLRYINSVSKEVVYLQHPLSCDKWGLVEARRFIRKKSYRCFDELKPCSCGWDEARQQL